MVRVDDVLADKYRVERVLGQGGMGYVVAAIHIQLDQRVAIKILMPELCEHREAVERFLREARAAVRIQSEHVARVLDVGTLHDGTPFMVMEFLSGRDLARELDARGGLPIKEAVLFLLQSCEAVAEAHALGVIHRDLKPANLFLTQRNDGSPLVKVLDFGVAKAIAQDAVELPSLTASQSVIGSPQYMSPEQVRNPKGVDFRTDVWSLGIILHELLTAAPPFEGDTPFSLLAAIVSDPPQALRDKRADAPEELEAIIVKCLEKNPDKRYQTVAELAQALAPHAPNSALASIRRISRITPWSAPPPANVRTMPSAGSSSDPAPTPSVSTRRDGTRQSSRGGDTRQSNGAKDTKTNWDKSQPQASRFRRSAAVAFGVAGGIAAAAVVWFARGRPADHVVADSATAAVPAAPSTPVVNAPPAATPPTLVAAAQPSSESAVPDAGATARSPSAAISAAPRLRNASTSPGSACSF